MIAEDIEQQVVFMQNIFKGVSDLILKRAGNVSFTEKHDTSPVTASDIEVEGIIIGKFTQQFPGVAIFGEETGYEQNTATEFWLIDPIDGTKAFIENIPTYTNMAVLISGGEAVASVIYNPSTDAMYTARLGKGAYKNGIKLDLSQVALPPTALCKAIHTEALDHILQSSKINCIIAPDGGGHGFTMVADGLAAARFQLHSRGYTHDYAPGALLVKEAYGDIVATTADYTYESRSFVACHPDLTNVICEHLNEIRGLEVNQ
jgi:fructose-1,6-bisphosphatase/inositol monophosphatase family enzyme